MDGAKEFLKRVLPSSMLKAYRRMRGSQRYTYDEDGLASSHNCDFIKDERFQRAYAAGKATGSWGDADIRWRAHVVCWAASKGLTLDGDFVECGVNRGGYSMTVMTYLDFDRLDRAFYLLDTFCGLADELISDAERRHGIHEVRYADCYQDVVTAFRRFKNAVIVRGKVPETLSQVTSAKIAYLSIDMNCAAPEIAAAECFWNRLVSGACIVLDDYGWRPHFEQKIAFDAFARRNGVHILSLPTGQGLIVKP